MIIKLIDNVKDCWKLWSVRVYALIMVAPDVYNLIASYDLINGAPEPLIWTIRVLAIIGIVSRLIKQGGSDVTIKRDTDNS